MLSRMESLEVQWRNFRGLVRGPRLSFPRLTVLIGRNNVGKTSLYAPLLVLRQTLDAKDPGTALLARGPVLDVGNYRDFVHSHDTSRDVAFSMSIPRDDRLAGRLVDAPADAIDVTFACDRSGEVWLKSQVLSSSEGLIVSRSRTAPGEPFTFVSPFLPKNTSVGRPLREVSELKSSLTHEQPHGFLFSGAEGLRLPIAWREDEDRWRKVRPWFNATSRLYDLQGDANYRLRSTLGAIAYLGPLRSLPLRTYRLAAERPSDVGREGEYAPEILFRNRDSELRAQVEDWLVRLGYGSLSFEKSGDDYFQLYLGRAERRVNIAHSGFGVSQLLPILVQGYTAPPRATFISQQPEIHLNPAQQSIVADFLIDVANRGRRVIIETHSEHVLLRIRRRIAEGLLRAEEVALYYVEGKEGTTAVRRVPLGKGAEVDRKDWPVGFFEDQLEDAFRLAEAQARLAKPEEVLGNAD